MSQLRTYGDSTPNDNDSKAKKSRLVANFNPLPDADLLREILSYDPETGELWHKVRTERTYLVDSYTPGRLAGWNKRHAGTRALTANVNGYRSGTIFNVRVAAHRVIWKMVTGREPAIIDHKNGNGLDNRWENLREVTAQENAKNMARRSDNKSGLTAIWQNKPKAWGRKWSFVHTVHVDGKRRLRTQSFHCLGHALKARNSYYRANGYSERHGDCFRGAVQQ